MRRARARMVIAAERQKARRSGVTTVLTHPIVVGLTAALIGLVSGLVTSRVNADRELDQYWREQRLEVYNDYFLAAQNFEGALDSASAYVTLVLETGEPPTELDEQRMKELYADLEKRDDELTAERKPVEVFMGTEVREVITALDRRYTDQYLAYLAALRELTYDHRLEPATRTTFQDQYDHMTELSSFNFVIAIRSELGIKL